MLRRRGVRVGLGVVVLAATTAFGASGAFAARAHSSANPSSLVGNYTYNDSKGDHGEGLMLKSDHTLIFASGCSGIWVRSGSSFSMDINANCPGWGSAIYTGTVTSSGLSGTSKPGHVRVTTKGDGTWYAKRA